MPFRTVAVCAATILAADTAGAQPWPTKPLRIIVMNTPGSGADIVTRLIAAKMSESLGQQVVVDNRAGASGNIGAEITARAAPDGYTLAMITSQQPNVVALYDKLPYDLVNDFAPISLLASAPYFIYRRQSGAAGDHREGTRRARQKQTRQPQLWLGRFGLGAASGHRGIQKHDRHQSAARAL